MQFGGAVDAENVAGMGGDDAEVVRDHDDRDLAGQPREERMEFLRHAAVDIGGRLVQQQQFRLGGQCLRDQHPLALAARELRKAAVGVVRQPDALQHLADDLAIAPAVGAETVALDPTGQDDVARADGIALVEEEMLGHVADPAPDARGGVAQHANASIVRGDQTKEQLQQRGFAAAVRTDDAGQRAGRQREGCVVQDLLRPVAAADLLELDDRGGSRHGRSRSTLPASGGPNMASV